MSHDVVCIEVQRHHGSVPEWEAALSRHVGQVPPALSDSEVTRCTPATPEVFRARLEYGALDDSVLFKASASPNHFSRRLRYADALAPSPILLFIQLSGSHRFQQSGKTTVLRPGDWCLLDTLHRFDCWTMNERAEILGLTLGLPSNTEQDDLLHSGAANRLDGKLGTSRVLQSTLIESFAQMNNIAPSSARGLRNSIATMVWDALREQLASPSPPLYRDIQASRLKAYIESRLSDPALSVDAIAEGCGLSVRSVQRVFALDSAGSVSAYMWQGRLERCAEVLRDERQTRRSIADICQQWGFHNPSHFSRAFHEKFGVAPRTYRAG